MFLKALKATALIALEVMIDDDKKSDQDKFIDEYNDGMGNVNFYGDEYTEQEAREGDDRGEFSY
ncbi:hypothetical protein N473_01400 [Pseudoalteromonas luteoviolacea CPMOR-1]|uniref:Uncharacterized protein n=1 Tax=Pseudoalteromonas luteoviolacea CPMOR-1 TaxID=1365248 RepID=A0A167LUU0_9GAMM|nr:hypothetical protein [Pseudoalteromonas luteoviolacea]KZN65258.1 hypothetical protein N473_01400 [Pseudoalteromonas luteoviolacea CPMOR-1]